MMRDHHLSGEKRGKEYQAEYSFDEDVIKSKQCKLEFVLDKASKDGTVRYAILDLVSMIRSSTRESATASAILSRSSPRSPTPPTLPNSSA